MPINIYVCHFSCREMPKGALASSRTTPKWRGGYGEWCGERERGGEEIKRADDEDIIVWQCFF